MSETRRSVARVRQLSLQSPISRRWQIRRQKTSDDEKSPKIHGDPIGSGRNRANSRSGSLRPKVRIAWGERHRENDSIDHVEVVARQITGKSKSALKKSQTRNMIVNEEKASILYSRQELTERLRLAWKHREENKANIDIFLAHGVVEERCDSESSNYTTISEPQTPISKSEILQSTKDSHLITDLNNSDISRSDNTYEIQITKRTDSLGGRTDLNKDIEETKRPKKTKAIEDNFKVVKASSVKLQNDVCYSGPIERIKYVENNTNKTLEETIEVSADQSIENEKKVCIEKEDNIKLPTLKSEITTLNVLKTQNEAASAKQKRANFHSGTKRAFLYTEIDKTAVSRISNDTDIPSRLNSIERSSSYKRTMEIKQNETKNGPQNAMKSVNDQKPNRKSRSSSAPLQGRSSSRIQVNIVIDTFDSETVQKNSNEINDKGKVNEEEVVTDKKKEILSKPSYARSIRSAPIKKRFKNIKKRQHSVGSACKDEQCNGSRGRCRISTKDCDGKSNDVITMVSLVSSTESDSDLENSPNEAKLISQLREKLTTAPIIKTSTTQIPGNIKKPVKSVSFQRDSFDEDTILEKTQFDCVKTKNSLSQNRFIVIKDSEDLGEYGTSKESILWKSNEIKTALPMLSFVQDESESLCVPLMEHDMRSLAVPIGNVDDMKKKPPRIRNTSTLTVLDKKTTMIEMKKNNEAIATDDQLVARRTTMTAKFLLPKVNSNTEISLKEKNTDAIPIEMEPQFQTRKEKDCWHLYKRMCDKGVNVSFDTVLRGMLTPTEYRLRQKEYSQNF
ncbi:uncharacterized protein LOC118443095 isoform X1 [Vespa mandarinia]|uniref:uncharacterized protein LOC118443095 isoform X1 n=2 Tax=Vespa mandarinia TaxID=7446 RepID=UPI001622C4F3|nr:uncharacterized protein LOC118443095 isoform X1 [Vespa mandarinia]